MVELRWIKMFLFVILLLQFTAVTGQYSSLAVRVGDKVTLSNKNLMEDQDQCDGTYWTYSGSGNTVELVTRGKISEDARDKSDRLSLTENCSLVIKKVTAEDVGLYRNRQYKSEQQQGRGALIYLTIINLTAHEADKRVTLSCSASTHAWCGHTLKWLYEGKDVNEADNMQTSQSECSATVTFPSYYLKLKSQFLEFFQCQVTDLYSRKVQLFTFSPQSSGEDETTSTPSTTNPGEDRTSAPEVTDTSTTTQAVTGQYPSIAVRVGADVTLSCENVRDDQDQCNRTSWFFTGSRNIVELIHHGKIHEEAKSKSDRLSVTENCSLVIKKVTVEDVGLYSCRQFDRSGQRQGPDALVELSVVSMTEHEDRDQVTLYCSVWTHVLCIHTVKWLYEGKDVNGGNKDLETSQSECSATVTFPTSHLSQQSKYQDLFQCEVSDRHSRKVQLFTFSPQSSGEDKTSSTPTTTNPGETSTTAPEVTDTSTTTQGWLRFVIVSVGLTALIISVVTVNIWTRTKGKKTQMDDNNLHNDEDEDDGRVNYENV